MKSASQFYVAFIGTTSHFEMSGGCFAYDSNLRYPVGTAVLNESAGHSSITIRLAINIRNNN